MKHSECKNRLILFYEVDDPESRGSTTNLTDISTNVRNRGLSQRHFKLKDKKGVIRGSVDLFISFAEFIGDPANYSYNSATFSFGSDERKNLEVYSVTYPISTEQRDDDINISTDFVLRLKLTSVTGPQRFTKLKWILPSINGVPQERTLIFS